MRNDTGHDGRRGSSSNGQRGRRGTVATLGALVVAVVAGLLAGAPTASAYPGAPWFQPYFDSSSPYLQQRRGVQYFGPGKYYTGNFPDPDVLRVGDTYYAYGTSTGGAYLPVMQSTDLVNWAPRRPYDPGEIDPKFNPAADEWLNDGLLQPAAWGGNFSTGRMSKQLWAPGVEKFGDKYVAFYAVRLPTTVSPERYCLSVATADAPIGPFYDTSTTWLHCDNDPKGSIDPEPFVDPATGTPYLLWKSEGEVDLHSPRVYIRQLDASGTAFAPGSSATRLLEQGQAWEGHVVENPSMVRVGGQIYLFYSGNEWNSGDYATGYAVCSSVKGPCTKARTTPLLASDADQLGAGGASAFLDKAGALRLAYHSWNAPYTSYPSYPQCVASKTCETQGQRRMAITPVTGAGSKLAVGAGAPAGPTGSDRTQTETDPAPATPPMLWPDEACPKGVVPQDAFSDDDGIVHEKAIDCIRWWGVTAGKDGRYAPTGAVTRAQMATFLANAIDTRGDILPAATGDRFPDDDGSPHEANINRLAAAGIVSGKGSGYAPQELVTRAQMATFLVRAANHATGVALADGADYFSDDETSPHEANINRAAGAGLASGAGNGGFAPEAAVRRDQMASFLARALELYVEHGAPLPQD